MKIAIGGDHAGFIYKEKIINFLKEKGIEVRDFGPYAADSVDYPDFVHPVANAVANTEFDLGILICGSGNGVAMTANKHQGIRAAVCWNTDLAALSRRHNNANIICIPERFVEYGVAQGMVETFLDSGFEGGRHGRRVDKIPC